MVEDTDGGAYPHGAAVGDQLFGLGVVVIFRFFDRAVVYHPEEATAALSPSWCREEVGGSWGRHHHRCMD